ncbi:armadillo repeat only 4 [Arabidopsis thaliana]|uniref:Armadillo repeat only 4 n=1 Tax=Arabidopsis thaliana TaxID=3702 RepID=A0A1I9LTS0_ARATH|nr:armadillo repeat only 4 [Arabidopsis thaliana]ANM65978.1 armadillo repeat only 4 [Arabidopsis thaliana]|eukprot:NP_001327909.1 armadillo repeat only 4 [Arabidopsis thaliana]
MGEEESRIGDELSILVLTAERLRVAVDEAESFKTECGEVGKQVDRLAQMLRTLVRFVSSSSQQVYDRPIRRVIVDVKKNLERGFALVRKCRRHNIIRRVCTIINAADFRKVINLLESSNGDVKWILSVFDSDGDGSFGGGIVISLPPIATNDPILPWVWSLVASIQMGKLVDKIDAANQLGSLAGDNDRNKKIIVDEGGVSPLLRLLKESSSAEGQIAAATALGLLACDEDKMNKEVEKDPSSKLYRPLKSSKSNVYRDIGGSGSRTGNFKKERDNENPEVKHELKVNCAEALWMLARGNVANSRRITETKGLLSLAKIVEKEVGELQYNCLMTLMEITAAAESSADLRRAAFKTNSPAAKAVIDQMLWIIKDVDSPILKIPAIQSIGSLARTFPARETRMIKPLVEKLGSSNQEVAITAVISLQKFVCPENFLCAEHSKNIIEYGAIPLLMKLIRNVEQQMQLQCLALLCYLSVNASNHQQLEQAKVLTVLEGAERLAGLQNMELRELVSKAIYQLSLYNAGSHSQMLSYVGP